MAKKPTKRKTTKKKTARKPVATLKPLANQRSERGTPRDPEWLLELRKREEPLELAIDEYGKIVAASYDFNGNHDFNITIHHPDGDIEFGWDALRRRKKHGAESKAFRKLPYSKKKAWILRRLRRLGDDIGLDDDPPWTGGVKGMEIWLDESDDCDYEDCSSGGWMNEYLVGHPIHDALTPIERKLLGIRQGDAGGPASGGCMVTTVTCTLDDLNAIIRHKKLPFVVVEDKRFTKPSHSVLVKK